VIESILSGKRSSEGTVLVVDDEPNMAKATMRLLKSMGFDVLVATAGRKAIEICCSRGNEIDFVLLDMVLPEMTSRETLLQIRSLRPEIKVILMSGHSEQESIDSFEDMQLNGFLSKPFGFAELENAIQAALGSVD
jgi:two-component system, cell cycle sensor histidine kinase and response regulator CckA